MIMKAPSRFASAWVSVLLIAGAASSARAQSILFIGNSFTRSIPTPITAITKAKGKPFDFDVVAKSHTNWGYHIGKGAPETEKALTEKKWDFVVLQDLSDEPTHTGNVKAFMADGEAFYKKIRKLAPTAKVVLYETWAMGAESNTYTKDSTPTTFANPTEMSDELIKNYEALAAKLESLEPGEQVLLAPVGAAFARCSQLYPKIDLHGADHKHFSDTGRYLAALVIYATIYNDTPVGPGKTPGIKEDSETMANLQKVAKEVIDARNAAKK